MLEHYYPRYDHYYQRGIEEDLYTAKWGRMIQFLDLNQSAMTPFSEVVFGLIGFKSDKGVYINNGRVGAVEGPMSIRTQLAKLPWHFGDSVKVFDVGDIDGPNQSLEVLQHSLSKAIQKMRALNMTPIVLGGGHETAYGHYQGLSASLADDQVLPVINFDAHFDLRPYDKTGPNSGTGFRQMLDDLRAKQKPFPYFVLGLQEHHNQLSLFDVVAKAETIQFLTGFDLYQMSYTEVIDRLDRFLKPYDHLYLTVDMDCFASAHAPGVSAIQSFGINPNLAVLILQHLAASDKICGFDIVELSPPHDIDHHTAQLAASLIFYLTRIMVQVHD